MDVNAEEPELSLDDVFDNSKQNVGSSSTFRVNNSSNNKISNNSNNGGSWGYASMERRLDLNMSLDFGRQQGRIEHMLQSFDGDAVNKKQQVKESKQHQPGNNTVVSEDKRIPKRLGQLPQKRDELSAMVNLFERDLAIALAKVEKWRAQVNQGKAQTQQREHEQWQNFTSTISNHRDEEEDEKNITKEPELEHTYSSAKEDLDEPKQKKTKKKKRNQDDGDNTIPLETDQLPLLENNIPDEDCSVSNKKSKKKKKKKKDRKGSDAATEVSPSISTIDDANQSREVNGDVGTLLTQVELSVPVPKKKKKKKKLGRSDDDAVSLVPPLKDGDERCDSPNDDPLSKTSKNTRKKKGVESGGTQLQQSDDDDETEMECLIFDWKQWKRACEKERLTKLRKRRQRLQQKAAPPAEDPPLPNNGVRGFDWTKWREDQQREKLAVEALATPWALFSW